MSWPWLLPCNWQSFSRKQAIARIFREIFANFSSCSRSFRSFSKFSDVFGPVRTCLDAFGCVRMRLDAFGCVRMRLDAFGCVRMHSDTFGKFRKFWSEKCVFHISGRDFDRLDLRQPFCRYPATPTLLGGGIARRLSAGGVTPISLLILNSKE